MMITTTNELEAVCRRFAAFPFVTVDTEFVREYTFFAKVCLIQIASPQEAFCVDPLAPDIDLTPLFELMQNKNVVKVFHSARQDIEIFYQLMHCVPEPLFDTQIYAMVCGFGENASYQQLVQCLLNVALDKGMRVTDWERRPLSEAQIQYAMRDVTYLRDIYLILREKTQNLRREDWVKEEMALLSDSETYAPSDARLCERMRCSLSGSLAQSIYRELYLWREHKARTLNRPRRHVLKDDLLIELSVAHPQTLEDLKTLRSVPSAFLKEPKSTELLEVIKAGIQSKGQHSPLGGNKKSLSGVRKNLLEMLHLLLSVVSVEAEVAPRLIADQADLISFIEDDDTVPFLSGWRYELFGAQALLLRNGELGLYYQPQTQRICFKKPVAD